MHIDNFEYGSFFHGHRKRYANHTRFLFRSVSPHLPVLPSADARSTFPAAAHQRTGLCCVVDAPQLPLFDPDELYAVARASPGDRGPSPTGTGPVDCVADWLCSRPGHMLNEFIVERSVLNVHVTGTDDEYGQDFTASLSYVGLIDGHDQEALSEMDSRETPGGMFGYPANQASPSFNLPLNGNCEVEIVPLNGGSNRTVILDRQSMT